MPFRSEEKCHPEQMRPVVWLVLSGREFEGIPDLRPANMSYSDASQKEGEGRMNHCSHIPSMLPYEARFVLEGGICTN